MEYRGYISGLIRINAANGTFAGTVAGIRDVIYFEGASAEELEADFRRSIDSYLAACSRTGLEPARSG